MSKKKKKKGATQQPSLSPAKYLKEKARSLAIGKCYISEDIEACGEGNVIVTRMHKNGKVSVGVFLVDIFCLGVKDAFYMLSMEEYEFDLFATNMVDIGSCGSWESVKRDLGNPAFQSYRESSEMDIHKRFKQLLEMFN